MWHVLRILRMAIVKVSRTMNVYSISMCATIGGGNEWEKDNI